MRRLIVAEAHPHAGSYQEVLASPLTAVKDNSGHVFALFKLLMLYMCRCLSSTVPFFSLMCFKRTNATDSRMLNNASCMSSDARGISTKKTPAILIGNVVQNTKSFSDQVRQISFLFVR